MEGGHLERQGNGIQTEECKEARKKRIQIERRDSKKGRERHRRAHSWDQRRCRRGRRPWRDGCRGSSRRRRERTNPPPLPPAKKGYFSPLEVRYGGGEGGGFMAKRALPSWPAISWTRACNDRSLWTLDCYFSLHLIDGSSSTVTDGRLISLMRSCATDEVRRVPRHGSAGKQKACFKKFLKKKSKKNKPKNKKMEDFL